MFLDLIMLLMGTSLVLSCYQNCLGYHRYISMSISSSFSHRQSLYTKENLGLSCIKKSNAVDFFMPNLMDLEGSEMFLLDVE